MANPFDSRPADASELILALAETFPSDRIRPQDMATEESRADAMFRAGQRDLIDRLMEAYRLKEV